MTRSVSGNRHVERISGACLDQSRAIALAELWCSANEHPGETFEDIWKWILRHWGTEHEHLAPRVIISVVGKDEGFLSMAVGFGRRIVAGPESLTVMGLGGVCSSPDFRSEGLGAAVVRDQFSRVEAGEFPCSIFGTNPETVEFYEKLGAGRVSRSIANSMGRNPQANPFGDDVVMGFPSQFPWPEGRIDLLGCGY